MVGTTISHYKVLEKIGEGGMGEVYRATDTKLNRDVALKILPEQFASDSQRMARFQREAEVLASLDHPNIGQIYGIEDAGQTKALVLQLIEGPTLADKISQGPIPVEDALKIALQMAEGLEAAHEKGVIHRDLKPANIKITPEGQVKILDFGLAKALEAEAPDSSLSQSPTLTNAATQAGVILGTAAYMSPEQARGKPVDKRTDIWAFGTVLYEMLTGKRMFEGEDVVDTLAKVLQRGPNWKNLQANTTPRLRDLLERCLEKDLRRRKQSVADVRVDIERMSDEPEIPTAERPGPKGRRSVVISSSAAITGAIVVGLVAWGLWPVASMDPMRYSIVLPSGQDFDTYNPVAAVNISPDGHTIVYAGEQDSFKQLYRKSATDFEPVAIEGTEGANDPFFSPDGRWIGFFADGELRRVSLDGGAPVRITTAPLSWEGTWTQNDTIIYGGPDGLMEVPIDPADDSRPELLSSTGDDVFVHRRPQLLPGGRHVLFTTLGNEQRQDVAILALDTRQIRVLFQGSGARYSESGHLVFGRGNSLWAVPLDSESMKITGEEAPVGVENVQQDGYGTPQFGLSNNGTLVYKLSGLSAESTLVLTDRTGEVRKTIRDLSTLAYMPKLSPDGRHLLIGIQDSLTEEFALWNFDLERGIGGPLEEGGGTPAWRSDGERFAYITGEGDVIARNTDGSGTSEFLFRPKYSAWLASWSPDGQWVGITEFRPDTGKDAVAVSLDDTATKIDIASTIRDESFPMFSPDGEWIAYIAGRDGQHNIYVKRFPDGESYKISDGGDIPVWDGQGRKIYYSLGNRIMMVELDTSDGFRASPPQVLFEGPYRPFNFDVSPDGETFAMIQYDPSIRPRINVIQNWFDELKERVPVP